MQYICKIDVDDKTGIVDQMAIGSIEETQDDTLTGDLAQTDLETPVDRDSLQAEATLLESAIRERIHVSKKLIITVSVC